MDCCHTNKNSHDHATGGASHGHGMGHGEASTYLKRFWIVTALLIPLVLVHPQVSDFLGLGRFSLGPWIQFGISTIIFGFSLVFFQHALHEIKSKQYGMMTLVALAVGAGYIFSAVSTFMPSLEVEFYLEISTLVWVLLFGHYLEAKSSGVAGNALEEVAKLLPSKAHKLEAGEEIEVAVSDLVEGDQVVVKPGEKIPADGIIEKGSAHIDESLISGESKPVEKSVGNEVVAGSICTDGALTLKLTRVGESSTIGQIKKLIHKASQTKPRSQKIADKAAAILTLVAGLTSLITLIVWTLVLGEPFVFAITLAITVLVIACPHALGLAIPTVTTITTSLAVKNGFFIKDLAKIETIRQVDYIVFDKTGTLTKGEFGVGEVKTMAGENEEEVLKIAASLERSSSHVIGLSIVKEARAKNLTLKEVIGFSNIAGQGVKGKIDDREYIVGNAKLMEQFGHQTSDQKTGTVVFVATKEELLGQIVLADVIKESSRMAVKSLHDLGIKVAMLTGDNERVAKEVSRELNIDTYFAGVLPEDKYKKIKELQNGGQTVLMVGDGVNDAPALTQADAGVAVGAGTDVAVEAGDVVLTESDPQDVVKLIVLAKKVYRKMIQNLIWALGYNVVAIPAAAGVFAAWGFVLRPEIGALVMSLSTVIVVVNAMTLKGAKI